MCVVVWKCCGVECGVGVYCGVECGVGVCCGEVRSGGCVMERGKCVLCVL